MHISAKCNSGRIAIQWFHIKHYLDYHYTKFQPYTFRVQNKCVFLRDTRLWFPDYIEFVYNIIQQVNVWKGIVLMVFFSSDYQLVMSPFLFSSKFVNLISVMVHCIS